MYLTNLYPAPKSFAENENERFVFGAAVTARAAGLTPECAGRVKALWKSFCCGASELSLVPAAGGFRFELGDGADCAPDPGECYALAVTASGAAVVGRDEKALLDGIKTLL